MMHIVKCWKICTNSGDMLAFNTSDRKVIFDNIEYMPATAHEVNNIKSDELDISNLLSSDLITEYDIINGKYDNASIEVFILKDGVKITLICGHISSIEVAGSVFVAHVNGLKSMIDKPVCEIYSKTCRAKFCDSRCKLDIKNYSVDGIVGEIVNDKTFKADIVGHFNNGFIRINNKIMEIESHRNGIFVLKDRIPIQSGNTFTATMGCDKSFEMCQNQYANVINFRGEPCIPGAGAALGTP